MVNGACVWCMVQVVVLVHGGPVASERMAKTVPAVLDAFYPGELGGEAIVDTLLGESNPAGRLPYTVYHSDFARDIRDVDLRSAGGITYQVTDTNTNTNNQNRHLH